MKKLLLFIALFTASIANAKVAFLVPADNTNEISMQYESCDNGEQSPERRAWRWFNDNFVTPGNGQFICFNDLSNIPSDVKAIWIYIDRVGFNAEAFDNLFNADRKAQLQTFLNAGGNLFLCKQATRLEKDLVGATDGQSDVPGSGNVITPAYNDGGYIGAATWAVDFRFELPDDWQNRGGHAMFNGLPHRNENEAELIWTDGRQLTNNNCGFEFGWMGMNDIWDKGHFHAFEARNNCQILGGWANGDGLHYGGIIEFFPSGNRKGTVLMIGLAAYQWINNNAGNGWDNTKAMTQKALNYLNARPCAGDDVTSMEDKFANDAFFYPSNTTTFRTLHPDCEGLGAAYSIASDPNEIARIYDGKLQFKAAGTVTLHISLTENRAMKAWPKGTYEYDREITFAYANANAAQDAINEDFPGNGVVEEGEPAVQMAMRLHPSVRGMDSLSYTITNHYDETQGEAYKETKDGVTRLYFSKSGKVLLNIRLNEPGWTEAWPMGEKELTRVIEFNYTQEAGPTFPWPSQFETGAVGPNSVITLPETVEGLAVTYEVTGNGSLSDNVLTLANVESGSVTVNASVTETGIKVTWPVGTYNYNNTLAFHTAEVGYLLPAAESIDHMRGWYDNEQPEYNAAKWFQDNYIASGKGRFVTVDELPTLYAKGITALWVNIERIDIDNANGLLATSEESPKCAEKLETYVKAGGNVLLTKQATRLAYLMGRIAYAPAFNAGFYTTDNHGAERSIATKMGINLAAEHQLDMSGHRLFNNMLTWSDSKNVYLVGENCKKTYNYCSWQDFFTDGSETHAYNNDNIQRMRDFETAWDATVYGIQGNVGDYCLSNIIEFNATEDWAGRILTIGSTAYQWGSSNNMDELDNMKKLTANSLSYLLNEPLADEVYTRDVTPNKFGTICFGYAVEEGHIEGAHIYELTSFNATGDGVILTEVNEMVAGRPYFFLATADQLRLSYHGERVAAGSYHGLIGHISLSDATLPITKNDNNYILYNDELLFVDSDGINLPSERAYVKIDQIPAYQDEPAPAGAIRRVMAINRHNTPTAVDAVEHSMQQGIYDIMGRKLSAPQGAGIYIINGQKVVITH